MPVSERVERVERIIAEAVPEPTLRVVGGWPVLDPAALHGLAGEIVAAIAPHTEADTAGLLASTLVEFGAIVGSGPHALADSAEHPSRLFAVLVGDTAKGRKGTAGKNVERVTTAADKAFALDRRLNGFGSGEALVDAVRGSEENRDERLLVTEPEFARILSVAKRDGSTLSAIIRQAWDGGRLSVRSRAGTTVAENSHVCVLGHISADELRAKLTETEVAAGFANRFLFVCVRRSKLLPSGGNLDDGELAPFVRKFALFASEARKIGTLRRTPEAEALWTDLYGQMAADEPGGLLAAVIARDAAQMLRLSVTYALLDNTNRIDADHIRAAWALWGYCRDSAAYIFGESLGDPIADRLLRAARDAGFDGLDGRQRNALFAGHITRAQLETAMALLASKELITTETVETGGRPVVVIRASECEQSEQSRLKDKDNKPPLMVSCEQSELSELRPTDEAPPIDDDYIERMMSEYEGDQP